MHIPEGSLSTTIWVGAWFISCHAIGFSFKKTLHCLPGKMVFLMGVVSAFIFAVGMLNFPVLAGASGHLLGAVLAAVLLGPYAGAVVITAVLLAQCLIFQDGGLTTLGANILNMSVVGSLAGYWVYNILRKNIGGKIGILIGSAVASGLTVVAAASFAAFELALSDSVPLKVVLPSMVFVHMFIGIGEAAVTTLVISFILQARPDLIYKSQLI